jgi:hypothetical protein
VKQWLPVILIFAAILFLIFLTKGKAKDGAYWAARARRAKKKKAIMKLLVKDDLTENRQVSNIA